MRHSLECKRTCRTVVCLRYDLVTLAHDSSDRNNPVLHFRRQFVAPPPTQSRIQPVYLRFFSLLRCYTLERNFFMSQNAVRCAQKSSDRYSTCVMLSYFPKNWLVVFKIQSQSFVVSSQTVVNIFIRHKITVKGTVEWTIHKRSKLCTNKSIKEPSRCKWSDKSRGKTISSPRRPIR